MRSLKVKDYMATKLMTFTPDLNVVEAMKRILARGITAAPVVCEGKLVGQVSRRDVLHAAVDYRDR